jgi:hypothetical protein
MLFLYQCYIHGEATLATVGAYAPLIKKVKAFDLVKNAPQVHPQEYVYIHIRHVNPLRGTRISRDSSIHKQQT